MKQPGQMSMCMLISLCLMVALASGVSCDMGSFSGSSGVLNFRIENATASFATVTITVDLPAPEEPAGGSASSSDDGAAGMGLPETDAGPGGDLGAEVGASASPGFPLPVDSETEASPMTSGGVAKRIVRSKQSGAAHLEIGQDTVIRVLPGTASNGRLLCGSKLRFAATVTVGATLKEVLLGGEGMGTPGFDDGSVGLSGERFMLRGIQYFCGDTLVIRITDDGSRTGTGASNNPQGIVERYAAGEPLPDRSLEPDATNDGQSGDAGAGEDGGTGTQPQNTDIIRLKISNQTAFFMRVNLSTASAVVGEDVDITVPPGFTTEGRATCDTQLKLTVTTLDATRSAHVVLLGDGTGVPGFDEFSTGEVGDRTLIRNDHFACGDLIHVTITDPGAPQPNIEDAIVGWGNVQVSSGS